MKVDFAWPGAPAPFGRTPARLRSYAEGETDRLTDVVLCPPDHLAPVPCCAVTRAHLEQGFQTRIGVAIEQHRALRALLEGEGVRCHLLAPSPDLPDMCFTRDIGIATPFGHVALNPALPHRRQEAALMTEAFARWNVPVRRITRGTIEGGDICVARKGLLLVGSSGERTTSAGVEEFAAPFRAAGWRVLVCPFHADHLHLDTIFCMVAETLAIGCIELLDPAFVTAVLAEGITILPMPAESAATLGCNILALGDRRIVASDGPVADLLEGEGFCVRRIDVSEFAACGGGIHCLTQPVRRVPNRG